MEDTQNSSNIIYSKVSQGGKEKLIEVKLKNLTDLKKAIPHLKLPSIFSSAGANKSPAPSKDIKLKLDEYCRTCAGIKVPLVDIFSEKGKQMRLEQQMQHLENIDKDNSLSTQMCMDCICDLKMSYKFFMQIKKAEMKLKKISQSLNDSSAKSQLATETLNEYEDKSFLDDSMASISSDFDKDIKNELHVKHEDYDCSYLNESTIGDGNESFEEFDPDDTDDPCDSIMRSIDIESSAVTPELTDAEKKPAYRFDTTLNAYIKVGSDNESSFTENQKTDFEKIDEGIGKKKECKENLKEILSTQQRTPTKQLIKPKSTKRKLSPEGKSNDDVECPSKKSASKVNIDLKELKIPKIDLQDNTNVKKTEDGVIFVTAKGSKPNEMLLIKVKKVNKASDKKVEKPSVKKKADDKRLDEDRKRGKEIDKQIEEYKKKRVQILGDSANLTDASSEGVDLDVRTASGGSSTEGNSNSQENIVKSEITIKSDNEECILVNDDDSETEKRKQVRKEIKQRHETISRDLAEDHTERLKSILKQDNEDIEDFKTYLKGRKIVIPRLSDDDLISLFEHKYNVILERAPVEIKEEEPDETVDPFEITEPYECDFCDDTFATVDDQLEHERMHDFRLMHYCEDCDKEFITHKAKRAHNITCVQKLMCKYCDMILESKGKKRQHEQKHCDDQFGQLCDLCGEKFKHQGTLDQHVKSRHMNLEKVFKCPQCPKKFAFRTKLTFHLKSVHTNNRPFLCEDCGCNFKNPASLRHHRIRKHAPVDNKKTCQICSKLVPIYGMSKHMHTHKAYTINCPRCDKMFKNTSTLKQHLRIHEDQRQYKCDMCGVGFNRRDGLRLHLKVHEKPDSKGLKECVCQVCGEKFPSHSMLVIHRNRTHKDSRTYTCHICNRSMISTRSLEWHMLHIHNEVVPGLPKNAQSVDVETKRVACQHCDKSFKTEMILRTHIKNTHTPKEAMKCLDCDEKFTSEVRWKHHMMTEHQRLEGTIECPHCPKRFVNQLRLKTHMISHSDERPHTCDICGFMLKTKVQLIKHKQNRHSNERPLQCRYCQWRCKQVSALVCHERTHTNERPYQCSVCRQRFKYLGDKNKHERRHEVLGGSGFKRIVTGRNTSTKVLKRRSEQLGLGGERDPIAVSSGPDESSHGTGEAASEYQESADVDNLPESHFIKFEDASVATEGSEASYEHVYIATNETEGVSKVVIGMDETAVYTEEVTADNMEHNEVTITGDMIATDEYDETMLPAGTQIVQLTREDENGQIQMIPILIANSSFLDSDVANSEGTLATESIL